MKRAAILLALVAACAEAPTPRPEIRNVLLITLDTTRADFLSCLGGDEGNTPRLDELAARSVLFTDAASETNVTNPSHVTIMTGLRAIEHGVHDNSVPMPTDVDTLPGALGRKGLATVGFPAVGHVGKIPKWQGFDELLQADRGTLRATQITNRVLGWLDDHEREPFFAWAHYFDPHVIYSPPKRITEQFYTGDRNVGPGGLIAKHPYFEHQPLTVSWLGRTKDPAWPRAMYAGEVHYADREVGRLLDELEARGLADSTLVIVTADHGESLGEHGIFYEHMGLYEPQIRVPLIIAVPGLEPRVVDTRVSTLDITPTIAELLGVALETPISGLSLVPLLEGRTTEALESRALVHENAANHSVCVRSGRWKLIWPINTEHPILPGEPELYDLEADPDELDNLAGRIPERVAELKPLVQPWIDLGPKPVSGELDAETLAELRALGYTED